MSIRCKRCDHELATPPAPGDPCPICGAELVAERPLALDPGWEAERAGKVEAAAEPVRPNKRVGGLVLALTLVVVVVVAVVMILQRQPAAKGEEDISARVEITITAPRPVAVRIDGAKAGTTPIVIKLKGQRTRPMRVEGNGVTREVTPDRDQVVNLAPPK